MRHADRIPVELETELLLACLGALLTIDSSDPATLAAFDDIAASGEPFSYPELLREHEPHRLAGILCIALVGLLGSWYTGGAEQVAILAAHVRHAPPDDADAGCGILVRTLETLQALVDEQPLPAADAAERLARLLDEHAHAREVAHLASVAVRMTKRAGVPPDRGLMRFALRTMNRAEKRLFLALTPRAKYPAPRASGVPDDVVAELVFRAMHGVFVSFRKDPQPDAAIASVDDFNAVARAMLADRDYVVFTDVQLQYQHPGQAPADCPITRVELRFAQALLKRIDEVLVAAGEPEVTPYNLLIDLVCQLLLNRDAMERRHDEYLFDWFVLRGAKPYREGAFYEDGVVFVLPTPPTLQVVIGETVEDIGPWERYGFFAEKSRAFLRHAKSRLV